MSTAKDQEAILTGAYVDVTPSFHYHREYEIVKRFIERLTACNGGAEIHPDNGMDVDGYIDANLDHVRRAVSSILADDIERQIQITKDFPLRPALYLHPYEPYEGNKDVCTECDGLRDAMVHTL